jgi:hypothetical protein
MGDPKRSLARAVEYLAERLGLVLVDAADITTQWAEDDKITIRIKVWDNKTRSWKYPKTKAYQWSHQYISVKWPPLNGSAKYEVIEEVKGVERGAYPDAVDFIVDWREFERLVEEIAPVSVVPPPSRQPDEPTPEIQSPAVAEVRPEAPPTVTNMPAAAASAESAALLPAGIARPRNRMPLR